VEHQINSKIKDYSEAFQYKIDYRLFEDWETSKLEEIYENGSPRDRKNAALYSLQLAVDERVEQKISSETYEKVLASAIGHIDSYYHSQPEPELVIPETDKTTRRSGFPGWERWIDNFVDRIDQTPDVTVPVASGGLEHGILTAIRKDTELNIIRYSPNDHRDNKVLDWQPGIYHDKNIAVIDDSSTTGETLEAVSKHAQEHGANEVQTHAADEPITDLEFWAEMYLEN